MLITLMFSVVAQQCLDYSQGFFSFSCPASKKAGGHKKLAQDRARAPDPNWPMGYSMPWDVTSSIETGGVGVGGIAARGLAGCRPAGGEQLHCASFVHSNPFIIAVVILLVLSLSLLVSSFLFY